MIERAGSPERTERISKSKLRMHGIASFNGHTVDGSSVTIQAPSSGAFYAKGIFTTIAIYEGEPFRWDRHWNRIERDAAKLGIDLSDFPQTTTRAALNDLINENSIENARARITFFDESATALWPFESKRGTSMLITTAEFVNIPGNLKLTISPYLINSTSPLAGVKSNNYLEKIIAKDEAKHRNFDEAIQLNERGEVVSACMANVFWLKDGNMFTPSLETSCLPGTTREFVLENIGCKEVHGGIEELKSAEKIFLTSAGIGVVQVAEFEGRKMDLRDHPIMKLVPARR